MPLSHYFGIVKAGYNLIAEQNLLGYVDVDLKNTDEHFALMVTGDSMQPVLYDGDIVIVHQQNDVENGQVAVVLLGDEATIKKVVKHDDYIELIAYNSYYPPKRVDKGFKIIGRVIEARIKKIFE
jgi:repressor LexA